MEVAPADEEAGFVVRGGVCERVPSMVLVTRAELGSVWSGDIDGGVTCGMESSKSSFRKSVENLRLASSAAV